MKSVPYVFVVVAIAAVLLSSCSAENNQKNATPSSTDNIIDKQEIIAISSSRKGQHVPNHFVCMVNDAYMGKQQIEVPFEGKVFYGCCAMCKERIPVDESVRYAIDPHSLKKISKADAYIVVISDNDNVAYFENEGNYQAFLK